MPLYRPTLQLYRAHRLVAPTVLEPSRLPPSNHWLLVECGWCEICQVNQTPSNSPRESPLFFLLPFSEFCLTFSCIASSNLPRWHMVSSLGWERRAVVSWGRFNGGSYLGVADFQPFKDNQFLKPLQDLSCNVVDSLIHSPSLSRAAGAATDLDLGFVQGVDKSHLCVWLLFRHRKDLNVHFEEFTLRRPLQGLPQLRCG